MWRGLESWLERTFTNIQNSSCRTSDALPLLACEGTKHTNDADTHADNPPHTHTQIQMGAGIQLSMHEAPRFNAKH